MKIWDYFEYKIAKYYLSALINDDDSGLELDEVDEFETFIENAYANARMKGFTIGHWADDSDDDTNFARCEVTGLYADVTTVRLMVWKEA